MLCNKLTLICGKLICLWSAAIRVIEFVTSCRKQVKVIEALWFQPGKYFELNFQFNVGSATVCLPAKFRFLCFNFTISTNITSRSGSKQKAIEGIKDFFGEFKGKPKFPKKERRKEEDKNFKWTLLFISTRIKSPKLCTKEMEEESRSHKT